MRVADSLLRQGAERHDFLISTEMHHPCPLDLGRMLVPVFRDPGRNARVGSLNQRLDNAMVVEKIADCNDDIVAGMLEGSGLRVEALFSQKWDKRDSSKRVSL